MIPSLRTVPPHLPSTEKEHRDKLVAARSSSALVDPALGRSATCPSCPPAPEPVPPKMPSKVPGRSPPEGGEVGSEGC